MANGKRLGRVMTAMAVAMSAVAVAWSSAPARADGAYYRWADNAMTMSCSGTGTNIEVRVSNPKFEWANLPAGAEYARYRIIDGYPTADAPVAAPAGSGSVAYLDSVQILIGEYPLTYEVRYDTLVGGAVVYSSSVSIECTGPTTVPVTPVNVEGGLAVPTPPPEPTPDPSAPAFRRWADVAMTMECVGESPNIRIEHHNPTVEYNLPVDAQWLRHIVINGSVQEQGPYAVEQNAGTVTYGDSGTILLGWTYPISFEERIDTVVDGAVVYSSSVSIECAGPSSVPVPVTPVNVPGGAHPAPTPTPDPSAPQPTPGSSGSPYRRWADAGVTMTCSGAPPDVMVTIDNLTVEFANLPAGAEYVESRAWNGLVTDPLTPHPVEGPSGTQPYYPLGIDLFEYPVTFEWHIDTLVDGVVVYESSLSGRCDGPATVPITPVDVDLSVAPPGVGDQPAIVPLAPSRYLDTRGQATFDGSYDGGGRAAAGAVVHVPVAGRGSVPPDASGVVANLTVVLPSGDGYATLFPCTAEPPTASHVNYLAGEVLSNNAVVPLSPAGELCIFTLAPADFVVDVNGYVPTGSPVELFNPARYLDSRRGEPLFDGTSPGVGYQPGVRVLPDASVQVDVAGRGAVPAGAAAAIVNVTALASPSEPGFVSAHPCTGVPTGASTLNYAAGQIVPNGAIARLSPTGRLCAYTSASASLLLDVAGFVPAGTSSLATIPATRLLDTRPGEPVEPGAPPAARLVAGSVVEVQVTGRAGVPPGASAALLNVAVIGPDGPGFVSVYPCAGDPTVASSLNHATGGVVRANNAISQLGPSGTVCVYSLAGADVILDVTGWLT